MSNRLPHVVGSQKAYEQFLPQAEALVESDVRPFRADGSIALENINMGLDSITPHLDKIRIELPTMNTRELQQLPDLAWP